jgi:hypothetical protein
VFLMFRPIVYTFLNIARAVEKAGDLRWRCNRVVIGRLPCLRAGLRETPVSGRPTKETL